VLASLRADAWRIVLGLVGLGIAALLVRTYGEGASLPIAVLLIPVTAMALIARPAGTAVVGLAAIGIGVVEVSSGLFASSDMRLRFGALVVGSAIAVALALVRSRREEALAEREISLALARQQAEAQAIVGAMIEKLPPLAEAPDVPTVAAGACRLARELFGSDSASYWQVEGDECVLVAREPAGDLPVGTRMPLAGFVQPSQRMEGSRTGWVARDALARITRATPALQRTGTAVGTSTPIRVGGEPVAYLGLGWHDERSLPDAAWLGSLDRFADQVAIAKTVVRRRLAQHEAQSLGRRLQAGLLPVRLPDEGGVMVRSEYRPGTRHLLLGGDFLDVVRDPDDDSVSFLLGDVSGHGPEQAALGTMMRSAWMGIASLPSTTLKDWVSVLDYVVRERRPTEDLFVTAVMGRVDVRRRMLHYVLAGHPPPIMLAPSVTGLPTGDPPLGVLPEAVVTLHSVELPEEWALLLITDGFYEGRVEPGAVERVGYDGFLDILRERADDPYGDDDYLRRLADDLELRHGGPLSDDAAAILLTPRCTAADHDHSRP